MSLELRADRITGAQGDFHEIFLDGVPVTSIAGVASAGALSSLSDVDTTSLNHTPDDGEVLTWHQTHGHWMPMSPQAGSSWSSAPASATSTGSQGDMAFDANYLYICVSTNQWKRTPLSTW